MLNIAKFIQQTFEETKMTDWNLEFWSARQLMPILGYKEWRKFEWVIKKAKESCKNSWQLMIDHFVGGDKMVDLWSWSKRKINDFLLTRFAC